MLRSYLPVLACVIAFAFAPAAKAAPVYSADQLMLQTGGTTLKLTNYESIGVDANGNGILDIGDTLRGVFRITSGSRTAGGPILNPTGFELTGVFETEVLSVTPIPEGTASSSSFTFGPSAAFANEFGFAEGTMVAFYEDFSEDFDNVFGAANSMDAEGYATNGNLYATFGAAPGSVHGVDYHWTASGFADLGDFADFESTTVFAASLQLLSQPGSNLQFFADRTQSPVQEFSGLGWENILNELALQGNVRRNESDAPYPLESEDPIRVHTAAVPEPSSLVAWAGFAIFGGLAYRRRQKAAKA